MISRFVLVGLVSAMGISIPTRHELTSCVSVLHDWTANGLAALDASGHRASTRTFADWVPEPSRTSYVPIEPATSIVGVGDELNRMSDGVEVPPTPPRPRRPEALAPVVRRRDSTSAVGEEEELIVELHRMAAESRLSEALTAPPVERRHERPARGETHCRFSPGILSIAEAAPRWDPIEVSAGSSTDVAATLNRSAEGIDPPSAPRRPPATIAEVEKVFDGLPFAGPSIGEEKAIAAGTTRDTPARMTSGPARSSEVARAVDLTSEALMAWIRVLGGPSELRISSR